MKKTIFFSLLLLLIPLLSKAQEVRQHVREIGLNLHSFSDFGIRFKSGSNKTLLRIAINSLSASTTKSSGDSKTKSFGMGANFGIEKRSVITDKFYFYYGAEIITSYNRNSTHPNGEGGYLSWSLNSGIGISIGLAFNVYDNLYLSAELIPSVSYNYGEHYDSAYTFDFSSNKGISYNLVSPGAGLTLAYRFGQKK